MLALLDPNLIQPTMKIHRQFAAVVIALITNVAACVAAESSNQIPGVYVREGSSPPITETDRELLELKCILAPGVMQSDGLGTGYFLDLPRFRATGEVIYIKGQEYRCHYTPATRLEVCQSREFSNGKSLRYYRTNVYQVFTPELQRGHSLLTPEEVLNWNTSKQVNPANSFAYHGCTCLDAAKIEAHATSATNLLPSEETANRLYWYNTDPRDSDYATAREALKSLKGCGQNLS
jgi:hypothetical protein